MAIMDMCTANETRHNNTLRDMKSTGHWSIYLYRYARNNNEMCIRVCCVLCTTENVNLYETRRWAPDFVAVRRHMAQRFSQHFGFQAQPTQKWL